MRLSWYLILVSVVLAAAAPIDDEEESAVDVSPDVEEIVVESSDSTMRSQSISHDPPLDGETTETTVTRSEQLKDISHLDGHTPDPSLPSKEEPVQVRSKPGEGDAGTDDLLLDPVSSIFGSRVYQKLQKSLQLIQEQIDTMWNMSVNRTNVINIPDNFQDNTSHSKVINGTLVTVNETIHKVTDNGVQSVYQIKVISLRPEPIIARPVASFPLPAPIVQHEHTATDVPTTTDVPSTTLATGA